jgi:PDZ domain
MTASMKHFWLMLCGTSLSCFICGATATPVLGQTAQPTQQALQSEETEADGEVEEQVVEYEDESDESAADRPSAEQSEALQRRAGEQIGDDPRGRTVVMGMYVQEADNQRLKVVEVGTASPAFEAGIREGDEIVSFDGFQADSYRKWVDGIRKLVGESPEGKTMPIQLLRGDEVLNLRLRKPVSKADDPRLPMPQLVNPPSGQQGQFPAPSGPMPPTGQQPRQGSGGNSVGIANFSGGQPRNEAGSTTDRAMAEIYRLNGNQQLGQQPRAGSGLGSNPPVGGQQQPGIGQTNQGPASASGTAGQGAAAEGGGGQTPIGFAGFQDDQNGLMVMVDVGGLAPGNYTVSIDEAGIGGGRGSVSGQLPTDASPPQADPSQLQRQPPPSGREGNRVGPQQGTAPATSGGPGGQLQNPGGEPQGYQKLRLEIPRTVLAQVGGENRSDLPAASGSAANAASQVPRETPASGEINQLGTTPSGPSGTNGAADNQFDTPPPGTPSGGPSGGGLSGGGAMGTQVGMLTIDESGTGRLQQVVEGLQVQNVVGQSIVIHSQGAGTGTALPPNLDAGAAPLQAQGRVDDGQFPQDGGLPSAPQQPGAAQQQPSGLQAVDSPQVRDQSGQQQQTQQGGIVTQPGNGSPVAAGIIRLMTGRDPAGRAGRAAPQDLQQEGVQQRPANQPSSGQELR